MTVDEARAVAELPPIGDEKGGDMINSATYVQWMQSKQGAGGGDGFGDDQQPPDDPNAPADPNAADGGFGLEEEDADQQAQQPGPQGG
jgi:hypothetical protein